MNVKLSVVLFAAISMTLPGVAPGQGFRGGQREAFGDRFGAAPHVQRAPRRHGATDAADAMQRLRHWNEIALDSNALDHTPVAAGETRVFGEELGPTRTSRALAIVHIAIFDAINAITGEYQSYTGLAPGPRDADIGAAIAQATHDTLVALFPSQAASCDQLLAEDLKNIPAGRAKVNGVDVGSRAAAAILALRANDGSQVAEARVGIDFITSNDPGKWRQDPISQIPLAYGSHWGGVTPFVIVSGAQFRAAPPPALTSPEYTEAFNEVKRLGGDGVVTSTQRTLAQTIAALYWAYDGTAGLGTPPRLYNQIAVAIADQKHLRVAELARLLALVNVAMADVGIAAWETKYYYQFWRPVTAIREADQGTGPTGAGDGNPATIGDPTFTPLGAPASNLMGPNFTPPFPAYVSGHAAFGAALFQTLRNFFRTDGIAFTFVSDELNGVTRDNNQNVRPLIPRRFASLSEAEEENGQSRIYLGIHWAFDKTEGIAQGRHVADYVFRRAFVPRREPSDR
ncbi:MAG TPA: phosphatase PAP2 family protein [Burkholderiales bacterium]|nr:phosphatase PAP2 family protein [Burkholderiales bacterium]